MTCHSPFFLIWVISKNNTRTPSNWFCSIKPTKSTSSRKKLPINLWEFIATLSKPEKLEFWLTPPSVWMKKHAPKIFTKQRWRDLELRSSQLMNTSFTSFAKKQVKRELKRFNHIVPWIGATFSFFPFFPFFFFFHGRCPKEASSPRKYLDH